MSHLERSLVTSQSARQLLDAGDLIGASNRAYFAMFYAVRTVLAHIDPALAKARTRGTIIARFHKHVIMGMSLDRKHGRSIQDAEDLRLLADYDDLALDPDVVAGIVERAEQFVAAIALLLESPSS